VPSECSCRRLSYKYSKRIAETAGCPQAGGDTRHCRCAPQSRRHAFRREMTSSARPARRARRACPLPLLFLDSASRMERGPRASEGDARARSRTSLLRGGSCCRTGRRRQRRSDGTGDEGEVAHF
jgi:hypothetical protein